MATPLESILHECAEAAQSFLGRSHRKNMTLIEQLKSPYHFGRQKALARRFADFKQHVPGLEKPWDATSLCQVEWEAMNLTLKARLWHLRTHKKLVPCRNPLGSIIRIGPDAVLLGFDGTSCISTPLMHLVLRPHEPFQRMIWARLRYLAYRECVGTLVMGFKTPESVLARVARHPLFERNVLRYVARALRIPDSVSLDLPDKL